MSELEFRLLQALSINTQSIYSLERIFSLAFLLFDETVALTFHH